MRMRDFGTMYLPTALSNVKTTVLLTLLTAKGTQFDNVTLASKSG